MAEAKRITNVKRVSLEGLGHEWGDECFAFVTPATSDDQLAIVDADIENMSRKEQIKFQEDMVKSHFVAGKIKIYRDGAFVLDDMTADDAAQNMETSNKLYLMIMGVDTDPKDILKAATENELPKIDESTTQTQLSTESQSQTE